MRLYFLTCSCYVTTIVYKRAGDTSRRTCKDTNASNAEANSGGRWVCESFNALAVGPQCACDVQEDAGFAHGNEIPIRKNKSFVCVPEIAEEGVERWTYKNMNASSYSRSCKCHCKYYKSYT
ncbi:uncharacterized protein ACN427_002415 [Glossina fuscipes fuscipes]